MDYVVVMAGGRGERFWPLSRSRHPKQLLRLLSDKTLIQETIDRVKELIPVERTLIVTGESMKAGILSSVPDLTDQNILSEPDGKNTCLAIGLAAVHLLRRDQFATLVVLSSDHAIRPAERLREILNVATQVAITGDYLITLGVVPTRPETGYGYIEVSDRHTILDGIEVFKVNQFKEKPSRNIAQQYYFDRKHLWNSGMFIWTAKAYLQALERHMPQMYLDLKKYAEAIGSDNEEQARIELYRNAENISVDCGILEQAQNVLTVKSDFAWDDIGSWLALERIKPKDRDNNTLLGKAFSADSYETTVVNDSEGLIVTYGVSDLVIVKTNNIVFVAHKTRIPDIKQLITKLSQDPENEQYL